MRRPTLAETLLPCPRQESSLCLRCPLVQEDAGAVKPHPEGCITRPSPEAVETPRAERVVHVDFSQISFVFLIA